MKQQPVGHIQTGNRKKERICSQQTANKMPRTKKSWSVKPITFNENRAKSVSTLHSLSAFGAEVFAVVSVQPAKSMQSSTFIQVCTTIDKYGRHRVKRQRLKELVRAPNYHHCCRMVVAKKDELPDTFYLSQLNEVTCDVYTNHLTVCRFSCCFSHKPYDTLSPPDISLQ